MEEKPTVRLLRYEKRDRWQPNYAPVLTGQLTVRGARGGLINYHYLQSEQTLSYQTQKVSSGSLCVAIHSDPKQKFATLLLLAQFLVCCIHRLNSHSKAVIHTAILRTSGATARGVCLNAACRSARLMPLGTAPASAGPCRRQGHPELLPTQ